MASAPAPTLAARLLELAARQVGSTEEPAHSNRGPQIERFQQVTATIGQPWCVSFRQWLDVSIFGSTYAHGTANAYAYSAFAQAAGDTRAVPLVADAVVYHLGAGHLGTVVQVLGPTTFVAIEGNEGDAVKRVTRSTVAVPCVFVRRVELHRHG